MLLKYITEIYDWNMLLKYVTGICYWNILLKYVTEICYWISNVIFQSKILDKII